MGAVGVLGSRLVPIAEPSEYWQEEHKHVPLPPRPKNPVSPSHPPNSRLNFVSSSEVVDDGVYDVYSPEEHHIYLLSWSIVSIIPMLAIPQCAA